MQFHELSDPEMYVLICAVTFAPSSTNSLKMLYEVIESMEPPYAREAMHGATASLFRKLSELEHGSLDETSQRFTITQQLIDAVEMFTEGRASEDQNLSLICTEENQNCALVISIR